MSAVVPALILLAALGAADAGQAKPPDGVHEDTLWFPVGEQMTYRLHWGLLRVGEAQLSTGWVEEEGRRLLSITFTVKTNRLVEVVYPVEHQVENLVEPESFRPLRMTRRAREGKRITEGVLTFHWEEGFARWEDRQQDKVVEYPVAPGTLDFTTFMFALLRDFPDQGDERRYAVAVDGRTYDLKATIARRGRVRLPGSGATPGVNVNIAAVDGGLFVRTVPEELWITAAPVRRLAAMYMQVPVGRVRMVLLNHEPAASVSALDEDEDQSGTVSTEDPVPANNSSSETER